VRYLNQIVLESGDDKEAKPSLKPPKGE